jgi:hypothetical protein
MYPVVFHLQFSHEQKTLTSQDLYWDGISHSLYQPNVCSYSSGIIFPGHRDSDPDPICHSNDDIYSRPNIYAHTRAIILH